MFRYHFSYPWISASSVCLLRLLNVLVCEKGDRNDKCGSVSYVFGMAN